MEAHRHLVLVVDDNPDVRSGLAELLRGDGFLVDEAGDGAEALHRLTDGADPCAIVLDLEMPRMDGWQLRRALRRTGAGAIPVAVISTVPDVDGEPPPAAAQAFFPKPDIDTDGIRAFVERHCPG